jgi:tetratricopeptide (TPR) repeat protein
MKKNTNDPMKDLQRLLERQEFNSEEELSQFLNGLLGKKVPMISDFELTNQEKAQDLVHDAYELPPAKAKKNIEKALNLDSDCIEAYEYLAVTSTSEALSLTYLEKGIEIGKRIFGGEYLEQNKGFFWGMHETRPYMRCLHLYSNSLYQLGKIYEATQVLEEMIELNPNDNQGVRDELLLNFIETDQDNKFLIYFNQFKGDSRSIWLFTHVLFVYKTEGDTPKSRKLLSNAHKRNKHIIQRLVAMKMNADIPDTYTLGSESEADIYVQMALPAWIKVQGAIQWLETMQGRFK